MGNVIFSDFNTTFAAADLIVATDGIASSDFGTILGLTYSYLNDVFPAGTVGYTATYAPTPPPTEREEWRAQSTIPAGITGLEAQLNSILGNGAVITTSHSGGYVGARRSMRRRLRMRPFRP